ncbi:MAG: hypothetical protein HY883_01395, partial [Deltaproteobacteria bacterium]|nr:hypothetical protein [Deltaproteobacteria bacterium]
MLFKKWLGYENHKALIVLGAGASRGASFVKTNQNPKPPLDNDFFSQIQFIKKAANTEQIEKLLDFVNKEFGSTIGVSMEEVFSQADYTSRFHKEVHVDTGPVVKRYVEALNCFYKSLPLLFQKAIRGNCEFHETLVEQMESTDVVLSFNYDCLIDNALKEKADRKWK